MASAGATHLAVSVRGHPPTRPIDRPTNYPVDKEPLPPTGHHRPTRACPYHLGQSLGVWRAELGHSEPWGARAPPGGGVRGGLHRHHHRQLPRRQGAAATPHHRPTHACSDHLGQSQGFLGTHPAQIRAWDQHGGQPWPRESPPEVVKRGGRTRLTMNRNRP